MNIDTVKTCDFLKAVLGDIASDFAERAHELDATDTFAKDNYQDLKRHNVFSAMVPVALGGGGVSYSDMVGFVQALAQNCSSTALSLSMHQHLIATNTVNHAAGRPGEALLRRVADSEIILVSTGAKDWLTSNGNAVKVEGGYEITAAKHFSSGAPAGEILVTSALSQSSGGASEVLHFTVPMDTNGISLRDNWQAMGMRATGSQSIILDRVFVPDNAITLRRDAGQFHPLYCIILGVGLPLIMSVYRGIAEAAAKLAISHALKRPSDPLVQLQVGEMETLLSTLQLAHNHMISLVDNLSFVPTINIANQMLIRKTIISQNVLATCEKTIEIAGGAGYLRSGPLERLLRDAHAAQFHPLPAKQQQLFTGRLALGQNPI